jgi:hypothetical protein
MRADGAVRQVQPLDRQRRNSGDVRGRLHPLRTNPRPRRWTGPANAHPRPPAAPWPRTPPDRVQHPRADGSRKRGARTQERGLAVTGLAVHEHGHRHGHRRDRSAWPDANLPLPAEQGHRIHPVPAPPCIGAAVTTWRQSGIGSVDSCRTGRWRVRRRSKADDDSAVGPRRVTIDPAIRR